MTAIIARAGALAATALAATALASCAASVEGPLSVPLGLPRAKLAAELRHYDFCQRTGGGGDAEVFPRCARPGAEWADAWVVADYRSDRLVRLRRWERFGDDERARERWNELVAARTRTAGPPSDEARRRLIERQPLPPGTRTWTAFRSGTMALVGVYLLTPTAPENASILEEIVEASAGNERAQSIEPSQ